MGTNVIEYSTWVDTISIQFTIIISTFELKSQSFSSDESVLYGTGGVVHS